MHNTLIDSNIHYQIQIFLVNYQYKYMLGKDLIIIKVIIELDNIFYNILIELQDFYPSPIIYTHKSNYEYNPS